MTPSKLSKASEKTLTAPAGPAGARGETGAPGKDGINGNDGMDGKDGTDGEGPAFAVTNDSGIVTTSLTDTSTHSIATLQVPSAGHYTVTAKLKVFAHGGNGLTASGGGAPETDDATSSLENNASVGIAQTVAPLQLTHQFSGAGTINLSCEQSGLTNGGTMFTWSRASIIATQMSALTSTSVSS